MRTATLPRGVISSVLVSDASSGRVQTPWCESRRGSQIYFNKEQTLRREEAVCKYFMNDILNKAIVLVLNRNWQAVNVRTPQEAFCMMATNAATALEIEGENHVRPVAWAEWITLAIRPQDNAVQTVRGPIRVPTVIVAVSPCSSRRTPRG